MRKRFFAFWLGLAVLFGNGVSTRGQGTMTAQLRGNVHDASGAAIPNAAVALNDIATGQIFTAKSNESGFYAFMNVPPGRYDLTAKSVGFALLRQMNLELSGGQQATIDLALNVDKNIIGDYFWSQATVIYPMQTEISQVLNAKQIQSLSINGRLLTNLLLLIPGVATGRSGLLSTVTEPPATTRISFNGQSEFSDSVLVDGANNVSTATGLQRAIRSQEAVSELRVVNNSFSAEYGQASGGIISIATQTGTNTLHGSLYDYLQNNATDARSFLSLPGFDRLQQNQFGGTLGGPIQKDKTFFFVNYEGQRRAQSPTYPALLVNNLAAINSLKTSLGLPPENLKVLQTANIDNGLFRVDQHFTDRNSLAVRYSVQDARDTNLLVGDTLDGGSIGAPSSGRNGLLRDQTLAGSETWVINPRVLNTALVQWARRNYGFPAVTGEPNLDVPNVLSFGHNFAAFDRYNESRVQIADSISWVQGKHSAKFGFDTSSVRNFVIWPGFTPARVIFPSLGDLLTSGKANWGSAPCPPPLVGLVAPCISQFSWGAPIGAGPFNPNQASPSIPTTWQNAFLLSEANDFSENLNHSYVGFFAQDQWRVTKALTLNYGMRYDFETGLGSFVSSDHHGVQPRIGLAYSPDPWTVIRASYGIFFDRYAMTPFFLAGPQRPPVIPGLPTSNNQTTGTYLPNTDSLPTPCVLAGCPSPAPGTPLPPGTVPPPLLSAAFENLINNGAFPNNSQFAQGGTAVDHNLRMPYAEQASFQIQRDLGNGFSAAMGYLFAGGHRLVRPIDLNVGPPIATETGTGKDIYNFAVKDPNIPAPPGGSQGTNGFFDFMDSTGNSAYNALTLQVNETNNKYLSFGANYTFSKALDDGSSLTFVGMPQSNAQRNLERAVSNQNVRHRFVANAIATAPEHSFARNFQISSIVTLQSPRPFTMFVGFDANNDGNPFTDRVAASARNTYLGDSLRSFDTRLSRTVHFNEKYRMELALDAFNLFNRPNVDEVSTVYGAPDFIGPMPKHYKDGITGPNASFGSPVTVFNPRQLQFSAKLLF